MVESRSLNSFNNRDDIYKAAIVMLTLTEHYFRHVQEYAYVRLNGSTYHSISSSSPLTTELICLRWVSGATKSKYMINM
jgi:hypothetical protein